MNLQIRVEDLERALLNLLEEFEPTDPPELQVYVNGCLVYGEVADGTREIIHEAIRVLEDYEDEDLEG